MSVESLTALLGQETLERVMQLSGALPPEDRDVLLAIRDEPY